MDGMILGGFGSGSVLFGAQGGDIVEKMHSLGVAVMGGGEIFVSGSLILMRHVGSASFHSDFL